MGRPASPRLYFTVTRPEAAAAPSAFASATVEQMRANRTAFTGGPPGDSHQAQAGLRTTRVLARDCAQIATWSTGQPAGHHAPIVPLRDDLDDAAGQDVLGEPHGYEMLGSGNAPVLHESGARLPDLSLQVGRQGCPASLA